MPPRAPIPIAIQGHWILMEETPTLANHHIVLQGRLGCLVRVSPMWILQNGMNMKRRKDITQGWEFYNHWCCLVKGRRKRNEVHIYLLYHINNSEKHGLNSSQFCCFSSKNCCLGVNNSKIYTAHQFCELIFNHYLLFGQSSTIKHI